MLVAVKPVLFLALVACGPTPLGPRLDSGLDPDASPGSDAEDASSDGPQPYRHTIAIDGTDDFAAVDRFETTSSPSFAAMVSWDATNLYIGYSGPDLDPNVGGAGTKWLFVYLDTAAGGATASQQYNTQSAALPFGADHYLRHKADGTVSSLESYDGVNWALDISGGRPRQRLLRDVDLASRAGITDDDQRGCVDDQRAEPGGGNLRRAVHRQLRRRVQPRGHQASGGRARRRPRAERSGEREALTKRLDQAL